MIRVQICTEINVFKPIVNSTNAPSPPSELQKMEYICNLNKGY